ncbi:MAG: hypothetical protein SGI97_10405 [candidate division Zixibacteria bacterium]|nr:hypothetical protein [candidate division Zixibacteria bacterium]
MRVAQCHGNRLVTQQFLHRQQIHAAHHQMGGEGVAQVMKGEVLQLRAADRILKRRPHTRDVRPITSCKDEAGRYWQFG